MLGNKSRTIDELNHFKSTVAAEIYRLTADYGLWLSKNLRDETNIRKAKEKLKNDIKETFLFAAIAVIKGIELNQARILYRKDQLQEFLKEFEKAQPALPVANRNYRLLQPRDEGNEVLQQNGSEQAATASQAKKLVDYFSDTPTVAFSGERFNNLTDIAGGLDFHKLATAIVNAFPIFIFFIENNQKVNARPSHVDNSNFMFAFREGCYQQTWQYNLHAADVNVSQFSEKLCADHIYSYFPPYDIQYVDTYEDWGINAYMREVNTQLQACCKGEISLLEAEGNIYDWCFKQYHEVLNERSKSYNNVKNVLGDILKGYEVRIAAEAHKGNASDVRKNLFGYIMLKNIDREQKKAGEQTLILSEYLQSGNCRYTVDKAAIERYSETAPGSRNARRLYGKIEIFQVICQTVDSPQEVYNGSRQVAFENAINKLKEFNLVNAALGMRTMCIVKFQHSEGQEIYLPLEKVPEITEQVVKIGLVKHILIKKNKNSEAFKKAARLVKKINDDNAITQNDLFINEYASIDEEKFKQLETLANQADVILAINEETLRQCFKKWNLLKREDIETKISLVMRVIRVVILSAEVGNFDMQLSDQINCLLRAIASNSERPAEDFQLEHVTEDAVREFERQLYESTKNKLSDEETKRQESIYVISLDAEKLDNLIKQKKRLKALKKQLDEVKDENKLNAIEQNLIIIERELTQLNEELNHLVTERIKRDTLSALNTHSYLKFNKDINYYQDFTGLYEHALQENERAVRAVSSAESVNQGLEILIGTTHKCEIIHRVMEQVAPQNFDKNHASTDYIIGDILNEFSKYCQETKRGKHGDARARQLSQFFEGERPQTQEERKRNLVEKLDQLEKALVEEDSEEVDGRHLSKRIRTARNSTLYKLTFSAIEKLHRLEPEPQQGEVGGLEDRPNTPIQQLYDRAKKIKKS